MNSKTKQHSKELGRALKRNWKTATAPGIASVILLIILFVPLAKVPVETVETYYDTETQLVPVTETIIIKEPYTEAVNKEQALQDDMLVVNPDTYIIVPHFFDLGNKINPLVRGNFISLDGRSVHFLIFNSHPYEVYKSAFTPPPIYETRMASGNFMLVPTASEYYFVFDSYTYAEPRHFKLNLSLSWTETVTKYIDVSKEQVTYKQVPVQVSKQRKGISNERKSLFELLTS